MELTLTSSTLLGGDVSIPLLGFGTFKIPDGPDVEQAVTAALAAGYRHIDTAMIYGNEKGVGRAIAVSDVDRSDVFVTTKVWNSDQGYTSTLAAVDTSLANLGLDYVDLYLVHWPKPQHTADTWRAMEEIQATGKARAIGVSNFLIHHLDQLFTTANVPPAINQIEFSPHLQSPDLVAYCDEHDIVVEAWSPLKQGQIIDDPELRAIADAHGVTVPQVVLRWIIQQGIVAIPKTVTPSRITQNADLYGFRLSDAEMAAIAGMDRDERVGPNPDDIDF